VGKPATRYQIIQISGLITEDGSILHEGFSNKPFHPGAGYYRDDDVSIGDDFYADVVYEYDVEVVGQATRGDWYNPPEYPDVEINNVRVYEIKVWDDNGQEVPNPEQFEQEAIEHFNRYSLQSAREKELEEAMDSSHADYDADDFRYHERY